MKITGTINLDVRDIQPSYDYGTIVLNAGNKQFSIRLTKEAGEMLQSYLVDVLPNTLFSTIYKTYCNIGVMWGDMETVKLALDALVQSGDINKNQSIEKLSLDELRLINDWRLKYYENKLGVSLSEETFGKPLSSVAAGVISKNDLT